MADRRLAGEIAAIAGLDSGIDRATAIAFAREGASVAVTVNQLHRQARYHQGHDLRSLPYTLFRIRIRINAQPVLLR